MQIDIAIEETVSSLLDRKIQEAVPAILRGMVKEYFSGRTSYSAQETCELLDMSYNTLRKYTRDKHIEPVIIDGKAIYQEDQIQEFVRSGLWRKASFESVADRKKALSGHNKATSTTKTVV